MKLAEMRQMLSDRGIQLTKSLGQNFLHEEKVVAKIAAAGELTKTDKVLEIGPGLGPLTEVLLAQAGEVLAIEMDLRLVELLRLRFGSESRLQADATDGGPAKAVTTNLQLIHADALKYLETTPRDWRNYRIALICGPSSAMLQRLQPCVMPVRMMPTWSLL